VEEAQLFIEAAYSCHQRLSEQRLLSAASPDPAEVAEAAP
jgi:hypothetical protein